MIIKNRCFAWCVLLIAVVAAGVTTGQISQEKDQGVLIGVLRSNAPKGDKAMACKRLAIYGTEEAVPALAPLLADEELSSWTRIALEAIPGPAADGALREALGKLEGRLLVGTINSIGVRRDKRAVGALAQKLDASNANVASAAAVALGHIGGADAVKALEPRLANAPDAVRSAVAEGCILCAEGYLAEGGATQAVKLYDKVRASAVPEQRHLEAIRGAILARGSGGVPLLIEQLRSNDRERVGIGLRTARELAGRDVTEALAAELDRLPVDRRPLLLVALADRKDAAVLPTVLKAAQNDPTELRITAIRLLIRLGDVSCVPALLEAVATGDTELKEAAKETLVRLPGKEVDAALLRRLPQAKGRMRQTLIELAGQRQMEGALPAIVQSLTNEDASIRGAAVEAVGALGQGQEAADLVRLLQRTSDSRARASIEKALLAVTGRGGVKCIPHLRPLMQSSDDQLHMIGLHALAIVGGSEALAAVHSAVAGEAGAVQDEAVRILSTWPNNWPDDADAGQALLMLAKSGEKMSHKVLGLRGYLQYVRGNKNLAGSQKVAKVKSLLPLIERPEEKRLAIAVLGEAADPGSLELLRNFAADRAVTEEAYSAIVNLTSQDRPGLTRAQRREALQTVAKKSTNNRTKRRAREALNEVR